MLVDIVVPIATKSRSNARVHWRGRQKTTKNERSATCIMLLKTGLSTADRVDVVGGKERLTRTLIDAPLPCAVTLTRLSERFLDDDNVRDALKAVRDEVAAWLGVDDRDERVTWRYGQQKMQRGCFGVRVQLEAL